jgi:hypothetical protein
LFLSSGNEPTANPVCSPSSFNSVPNAGYYLKYAVTEYTEVTDVVTKVLLLKDFFMMFGNIKIIFTEHLIKSYSLTSLLMIIDLMSLLKEKE